MIMLPSPSSTGLVGKKPGDLRPGFLLRVRGAGLSYHGLGAGTSFPLPPREVLLSAPVCCGRSPAGVGWKSKATGARDSNTWLIEANSHRWRCPRLRLISSSD